MVIQETVSTKIDECRGGIDQCEVDIRFVACA